MFDNHVYYLVNHVDYRTREGLACPDACFTAHTPDTAPAAARPIMSGVHRKLGHLPAAVALMAESPELLKGFLSANAVFESTDLDPVAREVVVLTVATRNECHLCVAMHTATLARHGAAPELIDALRAGSEAARRAAGGAAPVHPAVPRPPGRRPGRRLAAFLPPAGSPGTPSTWCSASGRTPSRPSRTGSPTRRSTRPWPRTPGAGRLSRVSARNGSTSADQLGGPLSNSQWPQSSTTSPVTVSAYPRTCVATCSPRLARAPRRGPASAASWTGTALSAHVLPNGPEPVEAGAQVVRVAQVPGVLLDVVRADAPLFTMIESVNRSTQSVSRPAINCSGRPLRR